MITHEELKKIAALAKLSLDGEDLDALAEDVGAVIDFANDIAEADLSSFDLTERDEEYPLREDVAAPSVPAEKILSNAAESRGGYFVARG
ncbi:MAG: aspartyl/glutamyl-tRNA amidotransferase subunit C [Oscillospiraceae bacterium]|nr:aspartyl/glutamyl-tRNA amidotransferase subunit C [Oscillospiraceae bacterium]